MGDSNNKGAGRRKWWAIPLPVLAALAICFLSSAFVNPDSGPSTQENVTTPSVQNEPQVAAHPDNEGQTPKEDSGSGKFNLHDYLIPALLAVIGTLVIILYNRLDSEIKDQKKDLQDLKEKIEYEGLTQSLAKALNDCDTVKSKVRDIIDNQVASGDTFKKTLENTITSYTPIQDAIKTILKEAVISPSSFNDILTKAISDIQPVQDSIKKLIGHDILNENTITAFLKRLIQENVPVQDAIRESIGLTQNQLSVLKPYLDTLYDDRRQSLRHNDKNEVDDPKASVPMLPPRQSIQKDMILHTKIVEEPIQTGVDVNPRVSAVSDNPDNLDNSEKPVQYE